MNPASRDIAAESLLAFWAEAGVDAMLLDEPFDRIEAGKIAPIRLPEKPVAAPIAGQMWATLSLMNESDEFVRALTAKRFIVASGLAMALFAGWGFMESYGDAPHAPGWIVYILFWGLFGLVSPFIKNTR